VSDYRPSRGDLHLLAITRGLETYQQPHKFVLNVR
jgi:hypothetical protein